MALSRTFRRRHHVAPHLEIEVSAKRISQTIGCHRGSKGGGLELPTPAGRFTVMTTEEDSYDEKDLRRSPQWSEQDKGPLVYQESKLFNGETFLINVYDHTKRRAVTFETHGLESQDQFHIQYSYQDFDGLFRFNAELMNPNRKEGRFHWISERLAILTVPVSVPELPIYETVRKIPTGRMETGRPDG
eukprot:Skav212436  [mRNA]  locus=scaffold1479:283829:295999:+ [translate_table: standard]